MRTQITIGGRNSGKSTHLIKRAHEEGLYILVSNERRAADMFKQAKEMNLDIPFPITVKEYFRSSGLIGTSATRNGILIDDFDLIFNKIFDYTPVLEMTISDPYDWNIKRIGELEHGKVSIQAPEIDDDNVLPDSDFIGVTSEIKEYLVERLGNVEANKLLSYMNSGQYIMLTGPAATGKTTIREILLAIGYPYVIDENGVGGVIKCNNVMTGERKCRVEIFKELGIDQE